jgi:predicted transcriptional regulator
MRNAALSIRIPIELKRRLEQRAERERRSLSKQIMFDLEAITRNEVAPGRTRARLLGRYRGGKVPTDADIREVRDTLWARLRK